MKSTRLSFDQAERSASVVILKAEDVTGLAQLLAEFVRQGINFRAERDGPNYVIRFSGGF